MKNNTDNDLIILECTIRDGNYCVGFKFTEADTRLLVKQLSNLGFKWIEVGHGLGLGGSEAGKGEMPASDKELIKAAKETCGNSKIGMFFIPGIAKIDHLNMAVDAGLDFVRIGENANEAENAYPFIEHARKVGLIPCFNMMKTYAISPTTFAEKARGAVESGAEVVYCVDSAGSMLPNDIVEYFQAANEITDCNLGFHGHNNLMMAVVNSITAFQNGAKFVDSTLCGLGRSAGNTPTEVLIAVIKRMGIHVDIDLFEVMDVIDTYMWPLVSKNRTHNMIDVSCGYSQFHSSFLPKVMSVASKYHAELKRLLCQVSEHNLIDLDEKFLEKTAKKLSHSNIGQPSEELLSFFASRIDSSSINNSFESTIELINGLVVSSAKRSGARTVLQLFPSESEIEDFLMPQFILEDDSMIMGRITYGTFGILSKILDIAKNKVSIFVVERQKGWSIDAYKFVTARIGSKNVIPVYNEEIHQILFRKFLDFVSLDCEENPILVYNPNSIILNVLNSSFVNTSIFLYCNNIDHRLLNKHIIVLNDLSDWRNLSLQFKIIILGTCPTESDANQLSRGLSKDGRFVSMLPHFNSTLPLTIRKHMSHFDVNSAYSGIINLFISFQQWDQNIE